MAGLSLIGTPFFLSVGVSQYADVPLAFFFLATLCLVYLRDRSARNPSTGLALAGFTASLAAWTKNEGLLFLCAFLVVYFLKRVRTQGWRAASLETGWILLGAVPVLVVLGYFKLFIATPSDLFSASGLWLKALDPARYWLITRWLLKEVFLFGEWWIVPAPLVLAIYAKMLGKTPVSKDWSTGVATLTLTLCGYAAIYVITPYDLRWHLRFSLNRLFLQLWPSVLFLFFLVVRTPEEYLAGKTTSASDRTIAIPEQHTTL
jgi:hypothetical protein